jgi:carbon-monoxide dehydrogenase small subunit
MKVNFNLNHHPETWEVDPNEYLLDTLRAQDITSVRRGCDTTSCGVCTVLLDGVPVPSCSVLTVSVEGKKVLTVEGITKSAERLAEHMGHHGADQCGYCNPSLALTVYALKQEIKDPTDQDISEYLVGNLCRCTGYKGQEEAIKLYLEED